MMLITALLTLAAMAVAAPAAAFLPGERTLHEAHNAYPHHGLWRNRLERALASGLPLAVELDLVWYTNPETGTGRAVISHGPPLSGAEPTLDDYFFEPVRPIIEDALATGDPGDWPLITLNINDIRGNEIELFEAVWDEITAHAEWLCRAVKGPSPDPPAPIEVAPILVLAGGGRRETQVFYDRVPVGAPLYIFGRGSPDADADNFRRWINYPWSAVEHEGQPRAGEWTDEKQTRLEALVDNAHERGYWIRIYSMNGHGRVAGLRHGWNPFYNFGSLEAVCVRWTAALRAGVDFIATDQPEELSALIQTLVKKSR